MKEIENTKISHTHAHRKKIYVVFWLVLRCVMRNDALFIFYLADPKKASSIYLSIVDVHQLSFMRKFNQLLTYCGSSSASSMLCTLHGACFFS